MNAKERLEKTTHFSKTIKPIPKHQNKALEFPYLHYLKIIKVLSTFPQMPVWRRTGKIIPWSLNVMDLNLLEVTKLYIGQDWIFPWTQPWGSLIFDLFFFSKTKMSNFSIHTSCNIIHFETWHIVGELTFVNHI